ncbi:E3 ubiquitin-protein ligase IPI1 [Cardamine amara subsp. amara]|uniref:E3 ubiquitin-protein ligase IPI1 n=1 Tax=Cardamine amara subsp. amara TaxID=228776 RepID=A0ABD0Z818_CARAN
MSLESDINESKQVAVIDGDCQICFKTLANKDEDRTPVKLRCSHQYHLDCIGSAFNKKNKMQCPTCGQMEKGQWLYAQQDRPVGESNFDDVIFEMLRMDSTTPEWHDAMLPSVETQVDRTLPSSATSTSSAPYQMNIHVDDGVRMFTIWGSVSDFEMMLQRHLQGTVNDFLWQ